MSATGRSDVRHADDFYETPAWCVRRYLDACRHVEFGNERWLEPSAGAGAILRAVNAWREKACFAPVKWTAIELSPEHGLLDGDAGARVAHVDFLTPEVSTAVKFDLCIGNPPFKLAKEFIEKALECAVNVAFLLRLNFLEGDKRSAFFKKHACNVHVLPNRPSFLATGKTDATAYAWFEFGLCARRVLTVLATTPKAERLADRVAAV